MSEMRDSHGRRAARLDEAMTNEPVTDAGPREQTLQAAIDARHFRQAASPKPSTDATEAQVDAMLRKAVFRSTEHRYDLEPEAKPSDAGLVKRFARAMFDEWPLHAISPALAEQSGQSVGTPLTWENVLEMGGNHDGLLRLARGAVKAHLAHIEALTARLEEGLRMCAVSWEAAGRTPEADLFEDAAAHIEALTVRNRALERKLREFGCTMIDDVDATLSHKGGRDAGQP